MFLLEFFFGLMGSLILVHILSLHLPEPIKQRIGRSFWYLYAVILLAKGIYMQGSHGWSLLATAEIFLGLSLMYGLYFNLLFHDEKNENSEIETNN